MIPAKILNINQHIRQLEQESHRPINSVKLLAVSKGQPIESIIEAYHAGQCAFAENYLQEALIKINALKTYPIEWHFIGVIQSNKTKLIAENFSWVQGVCELAHAKRLAAARQSAQLKPLNICIQINLSGETTKSGIALTELLQLAAELREVPGLKLRGLMSILEPGLNNEAQRQSFRQLYAAWQSLNKAGFALDTLSMGMSADYPVATAEGATLIRIGSAIFGERTKTCIV